MFGYMLVMPTTFTCVVFFLLGLSTNYTIYNTIQKFLKTSQLQAKKIVCTPHIVICTRYRKLAWILHCNIFKRLKTKKIMKLKPNVVMEHVQIYGRQKNLYSAL
jgi:hypothetical protein